MAEKQWDKREWFDLQIKDPQDPSLKHITVPRALQICVRISEEHFKLISGSKSYNLNQIIAWYYSDRIKTTFPKITEEEKQKIKTSPLINKYKKQKKPKRITAVIHLILLALLDYECAKRKEKNKYSKYTRNALISYILNAWKIAKS